MLPRYILNRPEILISFTYEELDFLFIIMDENWIPDKDLELRERLADKFSKAINKLESSDPNE